MSYKNINKNFICDNCHKYVPKLKKGNRDHCPNCLYSKHIDIEPGDRLNKCLGFLIPLNIINKKNKTQIKYTCEKCGDTVYCITAIDDNLDILK